MFVLPRPFRVHPTTIHKIVWFSSFYSFSRYYFLLYRFKDGLQLRNGRRVDIITDHDGNLELRIARVTKRDSGAYTLRASNSTGAVESLCDVTVVESQHRHDTGLEQISLTNQL